jgi:hypothetical protein
MRELDGGYCRTCVLLAALVAGCSSHSSNTSDGGVNNGSDGGMNMGGDAGPPCGDGYHDITTRSCWTGEDVPTPSATTNSFEGATFDGRYLYFAPADGSNAMRYDTQAPFGTTSSWSSFDFSLGNAAATRYGGAAFDGRYVYFIPSLNTIVERYDTQGDFSSPSAWAGFDTTSLNAQANKFAGATFDGRYLYLIPGDGPLIARYDTQAAFTATSSWTAQSAPTATSDGFLGGVFDGRYLYFPSAKSVAGGDIVVERYDTQAAFDMATSWAQYDISHVDSGAGGFRGAAFDGRYVYLVPYTTSGLFPSAYGVVWRYDTQASFTADASWSRFDTAQLPDSPQGFFGAGFDGRYVYFVPNDSMAQALLVRVDTTGDFTMPTSWSTSSLGNADVSVAYGFDGAVFDGRFLYVIPGTGRGIARFDAKTPAEFPTLPAFHGSFF